MGERGRGSGFRVQGSGEGGGTGQGTRDRRPSGGELARLADCGVIRDCGHAAALAKVAPLVPLADESAPLADRVRSYLDVNCSVCHNPGRYFSAFDARYERDPNEQGLIEGPSYFHGEFNGAMRIIKPGSVQLSVAHMRLSSHDPHLRMPPLGTTVVDEEAQRVIAAWIESLGPAVELAKRPSDSK
jgi:hypothetical protein